MLRTLLDARPLASTREIENCFTENPSVNKTKNSYGFPFLAVIKL